TAFVNGARGFGRDVARNAAGETELLEEPLHPLGILGDVWIDLAVSAFEVGVGDQRRPAVPGTDDVDHVQVIMLDDSIQMNIEHIEARRGAPMSQEARLDVLPRERLSQERVVEK